MKKDFNSVLPAIFPFGTPQEASWNDMHSISNILTPIISVPHYLYFPDGGGQSISKAYPYTSELFNGIELLLESSMFLIMKPIHLKLVNIDKSCNYFWIDCEAQTPISKQYTLSTEDCVELTTGNFIEMDYWGELYEEEPLPDTARRITRALRGSFMIFAKDSFYFNQIDLNAGKHNQMGCVDFQEYIKK